MGFDHGSRSVLTRRDLERFPGETLFARVARAVCEAECLPRKELYESWEVARRAHRVWKGARIVDLACGHGLTAQLLLLLDVSAPSATAVDRRLPASTERVAAAVAARWPSLRARVTFGESALESVALESGALVVSVHACGALTDLVLTRALDARTAVAVLPCCHDATASDAGALHGWMDDALAIDATRAARLRAAGYRVWTQTIPAAITPKNRLLLGAPGRGDRHGGAWVGATGTK